MAQRIRTGRSSGYQLAPGTYAKLLRSECEQRCAPDPRLLEEADFAELKAAGAVRAAEMFAERLAAGEPVAVPAWQVRGRPIPGMPAWLMTAAIHGGAVNVWVYHDEVVEPVASGPLTVGFEDIRVQPRHRPG